MSGGLAYRLRLSKLGLNYKPWVDHDAHPRLGWSFQSARTLKYEHGKGLAPPEWTCWSKAWPTEQATPVAHLNRGVYLRHPTRPWHLGGRHPVPSQTCQSPWQRILDRQRPALRNTIEGKTLGLRCGQQLSQHRCTIVWNWHSCPLLCYRPPWAPRSSQC